METSNETLRLGLVHRTVALGLAFATTAFVATSVAVLFTASGPTVTAALVRIAAAPLRALVGT